MRHISRRKFIISTAAIPPLVASCGTEESSNTDQNGRASTDQESSANSGVDIDAAQEEGTLQVYSTTSLDALDGLRAGFEKQYDIEPTFYRADSTEMAVRLNQELTAGRLGADVLLMDSSLMPTYTQDLLEWDPPSRQDIPSTYKQPTYTRIRMYIGAIAWNTDLVDSPPTDWEDFAEAQWEGRICLIDPNQTMVGVQQFEMLKDLYGDDYLSRLASNRPIADQAGIGNSQAIAAGQLDAGVSYGYSLFLAGAGAPYDIQFPNVTFAAGTEAGTFSDAAHPSAAKLFYDYTCSAEGQTALNSAGHSVATHPESDVPDAFTLDDVAEIYPTDFTTLADRAAELIDEFNELFNR